MILNSCEMNLRYVYMSVGSLDVNSKFASFGLGITLDRRKMVFSCTIPRFRFKEQRQFFCCNSVYIIK